MWYLPVYAFSPLAGARRLTFSGLLQVHRAKWSVPAKWVRVLDVTTRLKQQKVYLQLSSFWWLRKATVPDHLPIRWGNLHKPGALSDRWNRSLTYPYWIQSEHEKWTFVALGLWDIRVTTEILSLSQWESDLAFYLIFISYFTSATRMSKTKK